MPKGKPDIGASPLPEILPLAANLARQFGIETIVLYASSKSPALKPEAGEIEVISVTPGKAAKIPKNCLLVCPDSTHTTNDPKKALGEIAALLKDAKLALLTVPDRDLLLWRGDDKPPRFNLAEAVELATKEKLLVPFEGYTFSDGVNFERHHALLALTLDKKIADHLSEALKTGIGNFGLVDPAVASGGDRAKKTRVCIATNEVFGPSLNGGIGTAYTAIAELLAQNGHEVTILFNNNRETEEPLDHWVPFYKKKNITFVGLDPERSDELRWQDDYMWRAWASYKWLQEAEKAGQDFDVIHFPECNAQAYYALLAKRQGLAFARPIFCIGTHSSTRWIYECSRQKYDSTFQIQLEFMEQRCVEMADLVVSPSLYLIQWMRTQNWKVPAVSVGQQNIQPYSTRLADRAADKPLPTVKDVKEFVFFGRIETRKGIDTLCDALDELNKEKNFTENIKVTFMGKHVEIFGVPSGDFLNSRAEEGEWKFDWQMLSDKNQEEAVAYLQGAGRVAVMPSPVDNSPYTVLECIGLKIPFIATRAGGIPELIHPRDLAQCTFYHRDLAARPAMLASRMRSAIETGIRPPRRAVGADANDEEWLDWHQAMAGSAEKRKAFAAPKKGSCKVSVAILDDGEDSGDAKRAEKSLVAQAEEVAIYAAKDFQGLDRPSRLEVAATKSKGDYVLFVDPRVVASPDQVDTLVTVAENTGSDILTAFSESFQGNTELADPSTRATRNDYPLGQHPSLPIFWNSYGHGVYLFRKDRLKQLIKELPEAPSTATLKDGRLLTHATLLGYSQEVVPQILFDIEAPIQPKNEYGDDYPMDDASVDTYLHHMPEAAGLLVQFVRKQRDDAKGLMTEYWDLKWRVGEGYEKMEKQLSEKDSEIYSRDEKLRASDEKIQASDEKLREREEELKERDKALEARNKEVGELESKLETFAKHDLEAKVLREKADALQENAGAADAKADRAEAEVKELRAKLEGGFGRRLKFLFSGE